MLSNTLITSSKYV